MSDRPGSNSRSRLLIFSVCIALLSSVFIANVHSLNREPSLPKIQGVILPKASEVATFSLRDHHDRPFTNEDLKGHWSFLSYGYTHCPDVCPTLLSNLNKFQNLIDTNRQYQDVEILFYSIDPQRDSVKVLAEYVPFFNKEFLGLTLDQQTQDGHRAFERSLGLMAVISPAADEDPSNTVVQVAHGAYVYLINPDGKLQAVFKPQKHKVTGVLIFTAENLYRDYRAVRAYSDRL
jgi:protein SCO1/2